MVAAVHERTQSSLHVVLAPHGTQPAEILAMCNLKPFLCSLEAELGTIQVCEVAEKVVPVCTKHEKV